MYMLIDRSDVQWPMKGAFSNVAVVVVCYLYSSIPSMDPVSAVAVVDAAQMKWFVEPVTMATCNAY